MRSALTKSTRVVIATHELFYGASQALRDYLQIKKIANILYLSHPIRSENPYSYTQRFAYGKLVDEEKIKQQRSRTILGYLIDEVVNIWLLVHEPGVFDFYIGINPLNCLAGLLLKKLGKIKFVIFYAIDFIPRRFASSFIDRIYHAVESVCVRYADERWNVSPRIAEGREKFLHLSQKQYPQKVVAIGIWEKEIAVKPTHSKNPKVVYVGHLLEKQGLQLVLEALPLVVKAIPNIHLLVVGGGEYEEALRDKARTLGLEERVMFMGWVHDQKRIRQLLAECDLAVATYDPRGEASYNFTYYADPTKIKTYLSRGLPVVMTRVPYNAQEIAQAGCGVVVEYTAGSVSAAIARILKDRKKLLVMQQQALKTAKMFTWENIFNQAFSYDA